MKTILTLLLLVSIQAQAAEWTQADTAREVTYQVIAVMDWMQTRYISKHHATTLCGPNLPGCVVPSRDCGFYPGGCVSSGSGEMNPLLGKAPSTDKVDAYFILGGLAHYAISKALPESWRTGWQYVSIGFEGGVVAHNLSIGIKTDFP